MFLIFNKILIGIYKYMKLVSEHINETIKHLSPKTNDEHFNALKQTVEEFSKREDNEFSVDLFNFFNDPDETSFNIWEIVNAMWQELDVKTRKNLIWHLIMESSTFNRSFHNMIKDHTDQIYDEFLSESIKHLSPKSEADLQSAYTMAIKEIDEIYIRDDKLSYLEKYLDKDWEKVYWDVIMWMSDNEFDEFCHYVIMHPEEYKE